MKKHVQTSIKTKIAKALLLFVMVQLLLILLLTTAIKQRQQVLPENTETISIVVDDIEIIDSSISNKHSNKKVYLYSDSVKYRYGLIKKIRNIEERLLNKKLTVMYEKSTNILVDIRGENEVFFTISDYNDQQKIQMLFGVIGISIMELLVLMFFGLYLLLFCDIKKILYKRKSKKQTR